MTERIVYSASFGGFFSYFGIPLLILGFITLTGISEDIVFLFLALILISVGLILLLAFEGVLIDYPNRKIRHYKDFFLFKIGEWQSIQDYNEIKIFYSKQVKSGGRFNWNATQFVNYKVCFINSKGNRLFLKNCSGPDEAKILMKKISIKLNLIYTDKIEREK